MAIAGSRRIPVGGAVAAVVLCLAAAFQGFAQSPPAPQQLSPDDAKARETFVRVCVKCHPVERVTAEGRSRSQWENTIVAMQTSRGAVVTPEEFDIILDYLTKFHGRDASAAAARRLAGGPGPGGRGPRANVGRGGQSSRRPDRGRQRTKDLRDRMRDLPRGERARHRTRREPD